LLARAVQAEHADLGAGEERERNVLEDLALGRNDLAHAVHREDVLSHGVSWTGGPKKGRARATLAQADRLLSPPSAPAAGLGRKARAVEAHAMVLAVRRVAVMQRRQALGDRERRRQR